MHWETLETNTDKLQQWLDVQEAVLRGMESNPDTDEAHIQKQAALLQVSEWS